MGSVILIPYYHCSMRHHEFEVIPMNGETLKCDWCGADKPIILEEEESND